MKTLNSKLTIASTRAAIRATGCTVQRRAGGEWRILPPGAWALHSEDREAVAYYTDDAEDAINTAKALAAQVATGKPCSEPDFTLADHGSVILLTPETGAAKAFVQAFVDVPDWAWLGRGFAVEHRVAKNLLDGIQGNGLTVAS